MRVIALAGPKHCGKSTIAKKLHEIFGMPCFDLDLEIERRTGKSPRTLFTEGADVFRAAETETLAALLARLGSLSPQKNAPEGGGASLAVLALGGGIIDNSAAMSLLRGKDDISIVYLDVPADLAWQRIEQAARRGGGLPPFLQTENPQATHRALHERRAAAYREAASVSIACAGKRARTIALEIAHECAAH